MFTGIIQGIAVICKIFKKEKFCTYKMKFSNVLIKNLQIGASVSNNGCCLTVVKIKNNFVYFDIIEETLRVTNFSLLSSGDLVNIERSLKVGDEIGGHFIFGHVMHTAKIIDIIDLNNNKEIYFQLNNSNLIKYIFLKGFITIDGISLTVSNIYQDSFCVYFIPETVLNTNILIKKIGDIVNIEVDYYTQIVIDRFEKLFFLNRYFKK